MTQTSLIVIKHTVCIKHASLIRVFGEHRFVLLILAVLELTFSLFPCITFSDFLGRVLCHFFFCLILSTKLLTLCVNTQRHKMAALGVEFFCQTKPRWLSPRKGDAGALGKTEATVQPSPLHAADAPQPPHIIINNTEIKTVEKFCYLGSIVTSNGTLDAEMMQRIGKASTAFGRMAKRLWRIHGIRLSTKIAVYRAVVLSALLYCCETWTTYRRHIKLLEQFHQRCLRRICNIKWQDKKCGLLSIECDGQDILSAVEEKRIPKMILYGHLKAY
ncbi:uncharacterized protein LOC133650969 [Entelurus aequoreus]|uniref:uncharacterized protein LOC133650969 n=1 Tax=Entelurus aequoreus TaxID=161455 RepID=UPI002B1DDE86|nr:uncharacterized protein LOC133650969 [Entelurus aequoreus]